MHILATRDKRTDGREGGDLYFLFNKRVEHEYMFSKLVKPLVPQLHDELLSVKVATMLCL